MSFFGRLAGLFSRGGRDDSLLVQAMEHAKAKRPDKAMAIYDSLIHSPNTRGEVKARALFNRALANSSLSHDDKALADLERVLAMPNVPENVQNAARAQLVRVQKRASR
jgi:hypothetical protein